jgi:hypothetical protein
MSVKMLLCVGALASLAACAGVGGDEPVVITPTGPTDVLPAASSARHRMDIDQLDASILAATGGLTWTDANGDDQFIELASTLGKPDYIENTVEDTTPSLLFQKFLDDAARNVCDALVDRDVGATVAEDRVLTRWVDPAATLSSAPDAVDEQMRYLLLRFLGQKVDPGATQLQPWLDLFDGTATSAGDPMAGWRTVCVGLITHPDFYSY